MRVAESIILDALTRGGCIKTFTAYPHGRLLNRPRGYLRGIFWSRPASGKILCSRARTFMRWRSCWSRRKLWSRWSV
nr:hypothetical protein FBMMDGCC_00106 [Klebsiella pneumoniae subsp. pneumoniae]